MLYLSLSEIEMRFNKLKSIFRPKFLFVILFITSNLVILPLYYRSEKQDFRGLVNYLKANLRLGDKIFDGDRICTPGILHYFGILPESRHYMVKIKKDPKRGIEFKKSFIYQNRIFTIYYSKNCCEEYVADGSRLWIIVGKTSAKKISKETPFVLKGYFDGSFLNFSKFPDDASIYLFLWDPKSPDEKGIDMPIE
jgi:hypothetical protein